MLALINGSSLILIVGPHIYVWPSFNCRDHLFLFHSFWARVRLVCLKPICIIGVWVGEPEYTELWAVNNDLTAKEFVIIACHR